MKDILDQFLLPAAPIFSYIIVTIFLTLFECLRVRNQNFKFAFALLAPIASLGFVCLLWDYGPMLVPNSELDPAWLAAFKNSYQLDSLSLTTYAAISGFTLLALIFTRFHLENEDALGEILLLMLFISSGMLFLVSTTNLLVLFLALELLSLPTYVLVGVKGTDRKSCEGALKYFLFGSFASVLLLLSITLLYGQFGALSMTEIAAQVRVMAIHPGSPNILAYGALALFLIAGGFKIGMVPFHMWVPDAYMGAPTPITGFMGSAVKFAGFALLARVLWGIFLPLSARWIQIVDIFAVTTMFVGNLAALRQTDLKRLFAYSSVAHAGYLLMAITSISLQGPAQEALTYYLVVYGLMFLGLFACISVIEKATGTTEIYHLSGMGFSHPLLALCLVIFTLSAAGIPPTAGFFAKYFVFLQAVSAGKTPLVVLAFISSLIAVYYYLRVIVYLYMKESQETVVLPPLRLTYAGILACAGAMIYLAVVP